MISLTSLIDRFNILLPFGRWQLFEITDLAIVPDAIKHRCQDTLTAQWTRRLPFIQRQTPAELAANVVLEALSSIKDIDSSQWTVIDFCSGGGGPVPVIESFVNSDRHLEGKKPIPFRLSDLYPNIDAWMEHAALSDNLSFIPQSVDASYPPFSAISATTPGDKEAALQQGYVSNGSKVFRTFFLAFHHFDDTTAKRVLKSTLETSDAFAIVELQDRRIGTIMFMMLEFWLLFLISALWFWHDRAQLFLTYAVPLLPVIHYFDGIVSCLRTRTFPETIRLIEDAGGGKAGVYVDGRGTTTVRRGYWEFRHSRVLHTWPLGYMEVTFGKKVEESQWQMAETDH